ncbi:MFS transporter [Arthrobacter sp. K5]|uniref:MFS transporter n=1 Tax=Arthrobacter sp. K5 TaxID=2839623 RepID=A0AAU8EN92_9MICC
MHFERANRQQALIALVQILGLAVWFSASAVVPTLQREWGISAAAGVWLTASVQVGFVAGAVASTVLSLADRFRPQVLLGTCAAGAALTTAALAAFVDSLLPAIAIRFLTGVFLAGVYPVGMKLMASWSAPALRGKAFGILIGALTLGSAVPHLISSMGDLPWRNVMASAAALAATGALTAVVAIRPGPYAETASARPNRRYALAMFKEQRPKLANIGYFGHMWELYALWTWLPMYLLASQGGKDSTLQTGLTMFLTMGVGGVAGALFGGWAADRWGRPKAAAMALAVSGSCCLLSPLMFWAEGIPMLIFLLVWGAAVIADSGVFSTSLSENIDPRYIGTALTTQTAIGFLLTVVTIQLVPLFAAIVGWQYAFVLLLPGPLIGVMAMRRLARTEPPTRKVNHDPHSDPLPTQGRTDCPIVANDY